MCPHALAWYRCLITTYQYSTLIQNYSELFSSCALLNPAKELCFLLNTCLFIKQGIIKIVMSLILNVLVYVVMCFSGLSRASGIFINLCFDLESIFSTIYKGNSMLLPLYLVAFDLENSCWFYLLEFF